MAKQPNFKSHDYNYYSYCVWSTHWLGVVWCHFLVLKKEVTDLNFYRVVGEGRGRGPIRSKLFWGWMHKVNQAGMLWLQGTKAQYLNNSKL